jgi:hypothetical protein
MKTNQQPRPEALHAKACGGIKPLSTNKKQVLSFLLTILMFLVVKNLLFLDCKVCLS